MLFRRLVLCALLVGALAGLFLSAVQRWQVVPLIAAAERFEATAAGMPPVTAVAPPPHGAPGHDHALHHASSPTSAHSHADGIATAAPADAHGDHDHGAAEWSPAAGFERTAFTALANVLTAFGFGLLALAMMAGVQRWRGAVRLSPVHGLLWGLAGYLSFYVAPAMGLPPEIPGAQGAALAARQAWWLLAVGATAGGLTLLAFGRGPWRWVGVLLLAVPHLLGAPHAGLPFAEHAPAEAAQLTAIAQQFFVATAIANALYWLVLGSLSAWACRRWIADLLRERATVPNGFPAR